VLADYKPVSYNTEALHLAIFPEVHIEPRHLVIPAPPNFFKHRFPYEDAACAIENRVFFAAEKQCVLDIA
jgi:hypothetical protein